MSDTDNSAGNILSSRQDNARHLQQKAAYEDRLKAIKNKNADPLFLKNSKIKAPIEDYVVFRDKNVGSVWVETLNDKKRQEQSKMAPPTPQLEKRQMYSYQKKQVLLQDHFDAQVKASSEESDNIFAVARQLCKDFDPNRNQDLYNINSINDSFPIGDTQLFSVSSLESSSTVRVHRALSQNENLNSFITLQCGVYRDELNDSHTLNDLRAVAIAFRLNARHCFIALSVRQSTADASIDRLLGPRKIIVMSAAGQYNLGDNKRLFDRVINIVPAAIVKETVYEKLQISTDDVFVRSDSHGASSGASSHYRNTQPQSETLNNHNDEPEPVAAAYDEPQNSDDGYGYRPGDTSEEESQDGEDIDRSPYFRSHTETALSHHHHLASEATQGRYFENNAQHQNQGMPGVEPRGRSRSHSHSRDSRGEYSRSRSSGGRSYTSSYYSDGSYDRKGGEGGRGKEPPHYGNAEEEDFDPASWQTQYSSSKQNVLEGAFSVQDEDEYNDQQPICTTRSNKSNFSNHSGAQGQFNPRSQPLTEPYSRQSPATSPMRHCGGMLVVDESYWRVASRGVSDPVSVVMPLDLSEVVSLHCSSNLLVLEGRDSSTLFTGTLKSASTNSKYVINNDKVFQWTRGVYMRGWLMKWPSNSQQKLARPSQRYFVLKDRTLSYHRDEMRDDDDMLSAPTGKSFQLDADCSVKVGAHNLQRCIKVRTASSKLWMAVSDGSDEDERRWLSEIHKAIVTSSSPASPSQPAVSYSTHWYHESPRMNIVCVDAIAGSGGFGFVRVALFELCGLTGTPKGRLFSSSSSGTSKLQRPSEGFSSRAVESMHNLYFVEIGTESLEKLKLPVVLTNESVALPSQLVVAKLFGSDMVILGGSGGFLGVGAVGRTTGVALGKVRKVMYCVICRPPIAKNSSNAAADFSGGGGAKGTQVVHPHTSQSTITTLACGVSATVFAAADSDGVVSLWFLDREDDALRLSESPSKTNLAFYYKIKPALQCSLNISSLRDQNQSDVWNDERVLGMQFLCDDRYLAVSTTRRLLLLLVASGNNNMVSVSILPYRFAGWVEVDRVLLRDSTGLFGFHVEEQEVFVPGSGSGKNKKVATKITYWRALQNSLEESSSSNNKNGSQKISSSVRYTVSKFEWSSAMLTSILNQMQPL